MKTYRKKIKTSLANLNEANNISDTMFWFNKLCRFENSIKLLRYKLK